MFKIPYHYPCGCPLSKPAWSKLIDNLVRFECLTGRPLSQSPQPRKTCPIEAFAPDIPGYELEFVSFTVGATYSSPALELPDLRFYPIYGYPDIVEWHHLLPQEIYVCFAQLSTWIKNWEDFHGREQYADSVAL